NNLLLVMGQYLPIGGSAVIVSHGTKNALTFPVDTATTAQVNLLSVGALNEAMGITNEDDYAPIARKFGLDADYFIGICMALEAVRAKKPSHIALRACNVGQNLELLLELTRMFGADSLSAPAYRDAYGKLALVDGETDFEKKQRALGAPVATYTSPTL